MKSVQFQDHKWCKPIENESTWVELDDNERKKAQTFLRLANQRKKSVLYRGETRIRLGERVCNNPDAAVSKVAQGLFYFGEKSKLCWEQDVLCKLEENGNEWKSLFENLDDISSDMFEKILNSLRRLPANDIVSKFSENNGELWHAITTPALLDELVRRYENLEPDAARFVRNVFTYLLHTYSRRNHKTYTPLVSTTPDLKRAKHFAKQQLESCDEPLVIHLFIPAVARDDILCSNRISDYSRDLQELSFPPIRSLFFPENEVVFLGAIFPHFICGIQCLRSKIMLWNPEIFVSELSVDSTVWDFGFPLDQSSFEARLRNGTGYKMVIERTAKGLRDNSFG